MTQDALKQSRCESYSKEDGVAVYTFKMLDILSNEYKESKRKATEQFIDMHGALKIENSFEWCNREDLEDGIFKKIN